MAANAVRGDSTPINGRADRGFASHKKLQPDGSLLPFRPQRDCNSPARDDHPLASRGVPVVPAATIGSHTAKMFNPNCQKILRRRL